jgi:hypothetical protein
MIGTSMFGLASGRRRRSLRESSTLLVHSAWDIEETVVKSHYLTILPLTALGGMLLAQFAPLQSATPDTPHMLLRAERIELVDERGVVRARLSTEADGEVVFRLTDQKGEIRVKLGASSEGSGLMLANANTEPGVHILAKQTEATLKLKEGERERLIEP